MLGSPGAEIRGEADLDDRRKHRDSVLVTLSTPDDQLIGRKVDVLDPKPAAFQDTEAGPVEQTRHEARSAIQTFEHGPHLVTAQDDRQPLWARTILSSHGRSMFSTSR